MNTTPHEPRHPHLVAFACTALFVLVLCAPMFAGRFLIGPDSDQFVGGYAFRAYWTDYVRAYGAIPEWNPYIFGGIPFIAATHGDTFHPIVLLRLILPTDMAINASFLIHLVLAGFFTYLFLRALGLPWVAAVVGGVAYQLTGQVASLVASGHDGKIIVSSLLPLALWGLVRWVRDGRWQGVGIVGISVGLAILSPQLQMAYYLLMAAGLFTLYLAFFDPERPARRAALERMGVALAAVMVGAAVAAVHVWPFLEYIPHSPRSDTGVSSGWIHATSWAMPPEELAGTLLPEAWGLRALYSGRNFFKHHTEYIGVVTLILATVGVLQTARRQLRWALVAGAGFFLTFALAGATPIFRIWYAVLPMISKARAHSMAFYLVAFAVAVCAALGVETLLRREGKVRALTGWGVALGLLVLLAVTGVWTNLARGLADPAKIVNVAGNREALTLGALRIALFGAAAIGIVLAWGRGRLQPAVFGGLLVGLVGLDLVSVDRRFFVYSPRGAELFAPDAVTERISATPLPYRVFDAGVYGGSILMSYDVPQALGYHGNELRYYDDLLGGKNQWRYLYGSGQLWDLLALRFIILPDTQRLPGYTRVLGPVTTALGSTAYLYEADTVPPYARVATAAAKVPAEQLVPTLLDPRLEFERVVLLDPDQPVQPEPIATMPPPSPARANVTAWRPGRMTLALDPTPPAPSYVIVAENWYVDWRATVDGAPVTVLRGDQSLITVPVPAGARAVELEYRSTRYRQGRVVSLLATLLLVGCLVGPAAAKRWRRG